MSSAALSLLHCVVRLGTRKGMLQSFTEGHSGFWLVTELTAILWIVRIPYSCSRCPLVNHFKKGTVLVSASGPLVWAQESAASFCAQSSRTPCKSVLKVCNIVCSCLSFSA